MLGSEQSFPLVMILITTSKLCDYLSADPVRLRTLTSAVTSITRHLQATISG